MRYTDRVTLFSKGNKVYNPQTSSYEYKNSSEYKNIPANISPLSKARTSVEYGDIKRDINIVRLQGNFKEEVTHAKIKDKQYLIVNQIDYYHDTVFHVEEVK